MLDGASLPAIARFAGGSGRVLTRYTQVWVNGDCARSPSALTGRIVARDGRSLREKHCPYTGDHHSLAPDNGPGFSHKSGLDNNRTGRHGGAVPRQVALLKLPMQRPCSILPSSSHCPRLTRLLCGPILPMCSVSAEYRPNDCWNSAPPASRFSNPIGPRSTPCLRLPVEKKPCCVVKADRAVGAGRPCRAHGETMPASGVIPQSHSPRLSKGTITPAAEQTSRRSK